MYSFPGGRVDVLPVNGRVVVVRAFEEIRNWDAALGRPPPRGVLTTTDIGRGKNGDSGARLTGVARHGPSETFVIEETLRKHS